MKSQMLHLGDCTFEVLTEQRRFTGLGKVWIGKTLVRSGDCRCDGTCNCLAAWNWPG